MLVFRYANFKRRASGGLPTYVVPVCIRLSSRAHARFFLFWKEITMEENTNKTENNIKDIKRTKAEIYESLYDGE